MNNFINQNISIYSGVGIRKTAKSHVYIKKGTGKIIKNNSLIYNSINIADIYGNSNIEILIKPLILVNLLNKIDIQIYSIGGGFNSQLYSMRLGLSKALAKINKNIKKILNRYNELTQDVRIKERRKPGLRKARKATQYTKR